MAFFDELKRLEEASKQEEKISALLKTLIEQHKKTLLKRHLQAVYEGLKESIRQKFADGFFRQEDGEEIRGSYKFKAFVPMNYDFEPPFPEGVTSKMVKEAVSELDKVRTISRIRVEPSFKLTKKKQIRFGLKTKYEGDIFFEGEAYSFFEELDNMMKADGIKLISVTAPIVSISRLATLDYKQKVKSSYVESLDKDYSLTYEELSSITIRYSLEF